MLCRSVLVVLSVCFLLALHEQLLAYDLDSNTYFLDVSPGDFLRYMTSVVPLKSFNYSFNGNVHIGSESFKVIQFNEYTGLQYYIIEANGIDEKPNSTKWAHSARYYLRLKKTYVDVIYSTIDGALEKIFITVKEEYDYTGYGLSLKAQSSLSGGK